ncbi:MAG TPA: 30S ribosomal protein S13 [Candidatus Saccharimonadia bacterium]
MAVRISGVNVPEAKRVEVALTYVFGIGLTTSQKVLAATGVNPDTRVKDLTEAEVSKLRDYIDKNLRVEGDLQREVSLNIKRLKEINSYRGLRHKANLPVHGQRTKTNARTKRGKKITMGSGRKKASAKT